MKNTYLIFSFVIVSFFACKKKESVSPPVSTVTTQKADDAAAKTEMDRALDDIDKALEKTTFGGARVEQSNELQLPCGKVNLVIDNVKKTFTIDYAGINCGSKVLSGKLVTTLIKGNTFADSAAVLKVELMEYKVYYFASKQTITYNGTKYITNLTGGKMGDLMSKNITISHRIRGTAQIKFNESKDTVRTWNYARKKTFIAKQATSTSVLQLSGKWEGDTIINNVKNVEQWGSNKENFPFTNSVTEPFVWKNCPNVQANVLSFILHSGKATHISKTIRDGKELDFNYVATAGYTSINGVTKLVNDCSSNGYFIEFNITNPIVLNWSAYQPY